MSALCDCCGLGSTHHDVRHVRVIAVSRDIQVDRLALCHGCRTRPDRAWRRRWKPAAA